MPLYALLITALGTDAAAPAGHIEGIVANGTLGGAPVAAAEVVLRAGQDGAFRAVAKTVTDEDGRFHFYNLPAETGVIYLPGANRHGVHYPGPRVRPDVAALAPVKLTVFDAVASPSPLVAERHAIDVRLQAGVLEVTESLLVNNPTRTTYIGESDRKPLTTLSLAIPAGFERVTFATEFFGRRFSVFENRLVTDIPWLPGKYELNFTYHLPAAESPLTAERTLDLPTSAVRVRAKADQPCQVTCNLPSGGASEDWPFVFASSTEPLAAGHAIKLVFGDLSAQWTLHAPWIAVVVLAGLILTTTLARRRLGSKEVARQVTRRGKRSPGRTQRCGRGLPKAAR
jgi:hypothetical protein